MRKETWVKQKGYCLPRRSSSAAAVQEYNPVHPAVLFLFLLYAICLQEKQTSQHHPLPYTKHLTT